MLRYQLTHISSWHIHKILFALKIPQNNNKKKQEQGYNLHVECSFLSKFPLPPTILSHVQSLQHRLSYRPQYIIRQTKKEG